MSGSRRWYHGPCSETRGRGVLVTGSTEAFVRDTATTQISFFAPHRARLGLGIISRIFLTPPPPRMLGTRCHRCRWRCLESLCRRIDFCRLIHGSSSYWIIVLHQSQSANLARHLLSRLERRVNSRGWLGWKETCGSLSVGDEPSSTDAGSDVRRRSSDTRSLAQAYCLGTA